MSEAGRLKLRSQWALVMAKVFNRLRWVFQGTATRMETFAVVHNMRRQVEREARMTGLMTLLLVDEIRGWWRWEAENTADETGEVVAGLRQSCVGIGRPCGNAERDRGQGG